MESDNLISKVKVEKNQLKSIDKFNNIKSKYILVKVFKNLKKEKTLNIVKYKKKNKYKY